MMVVYISFPTTQSYDRPFDRIHLCSIGSWYVSCYPAQMASSQYRHVCLVQGNVRDLLITKDGVASYKYQHQLRHTTCTNTSFTFTYIIHSRDIADTSLE